MEKRKPTHDLDAFKAACASAKTFASTATAIATAASLGFGRADVVATIQTMQRSHFHKSMTSYGNHRKWQDVYFVPSAAGIIYLKFTDDVVCAFRLLSFKEKGDG